jgi:hypothetical protein
VESEKLERNFRRHDLIPLVLRACSRLGPHRAMHADIAYGKSLLRAPSVMSYKGRPLEYLCLLSLLSSREIIFLYILFEKTDNFLNHLIIIIFLRQNNN